MVNYDDWKPIKHVETGITAEDFEKASEIIIETGLREPVPIVTIGLTVGEVK